ncbi:MAG: hypothetical protein LUF80_05690 [Oscillospiraceae bacterium]|nr:hypothetical protein [Oscillospiraceae bacterium]
MDRTGKIAIAVAGVLAGLAVVLSLAFLYVTILYPAYYKTEVVDVQRSPDGTHQVTLQSVGTPYFPFGSAPGQLILSGDESVISRARIEIANDGGSFTENSWSVAWYDDRVEITLSGSEQLDELVSLHFDGQIESVRLDTHYGKITESETAERTDHADEEEGDTEQELFSGQQQIEDGYLALYEFLSNGRSDSFELYYGASESSTRCVVSEYADTVEYLVYNRNSQNGACGLYVYYRCKICADGTWDDDNGSILDIYAYVYESGDIVSSGKTQWGDVASAAYQEAAGEA